MTDLREPRGAHLEHAPVSWRALRLDHVVRIEMQIVRGEASS